MLTGQAAYTVYVDVVEDRQQPTAGGLGENETESGNAKLLIQPTIFPNWYNCGRTSMTSLIPPLLSPQRLRTSLSLSLGPQSSYL